MNRSPAQFSIPPVSQAVKAILILSCALFLVDLTLANFAGFSLAPILGFVPARILDGWLWQPITYAFLHSGLFHILFNLLIVWSVGSELEKLWGTATFVGFFFVCAVGGAIGYGIFSLAGIGGGPSNPVVGSSGVVYGLLLAYGILFGDRLMYFFMIFPMPAKYFVMILGAVEMISAVFYGKDGVAHLAHLGGMLSGFLYMIAMAAWRQRAKNELSEEWAARERQKRIKKAGHLKLVPGSEEEEGKPKHWN